MAVTREIIERQVILFCLNDISNFLKYIIFLRPEDIENESYKEVYRLQYEKYNENQSLHNKEFLIDLVSSQLEQKNKSIKELDGLKTEEPKTESQDTIKKYMRQFVSDDRLLKSLSDCAIKVEKQQYTKEEILDIIRKGLIISDDLDFGQSVWDFDIRIKKLQKIMQDAIPSFSNLLNQYISRGYYPKELYVFMAAPGVGKSLFLMQEAYHSMVRQHKKSVYFTFELSQERVGLRFDSRASKKTITEIFSNIQDVKDKYKQIKMASGDGDIIIKEYPTGGATVMDMNIFLDQLKIYKNYVPDIIYVDYGDIIKPDVDRKTTYENQGEVFTALRRMAMERNIPVVTATQAQRGILEKKFEDVSMGQVSDSFTISRISDSMFAIVQSADDRTHDILHLKIIKNRNGVVNKKITFEVHYNTMYLNDSQVQDDKNK